jgi:hypothetical protein
MLKPEENYNNRSIYSGMYNDRKYKTFEESELFTESVYNYYRNTFTNYIKLFD